MVSGTHRYRSKHLGRGVQSTGAREMLDSGGPCTTCSNVASGGNTCLPDRGLEFSLALRSGR
eukprot:CAMPEP_0179331662 /NCGR_PEP_ID=MMETSP0797-20121207/64309_1 /TAXON_ID=47934 /ORGANISM="Dinophysis acuminata, Strain DAEP01" /LENGTH=61 /DNA_ID=CAMNT_0021044457 /DNA_START=31 /DNA_END=212 /DNA_ORIENTATION=-